VAGILNNDQELLGEIRRHILVIHGVELAFSQILRYVENPKEYMPPPPLVEKIYQHFRARNPTYSTERALIFLRIPFSEGEIEKLRKIVRSRRRDKACGLITMKDIASIIDSKPAD
jgi:hypothetical protein